MRTPQQIIADWDLATKDHPMILMADEADNFSKAMRLLANSEQSRMRSVTIIDKDKVINGGMKSPIDGKVYGNRSDWNNHLKANDCVEMGNDLNNAKPRTEIRGDFATKEDVGRAVNEVFERRGIK
jgi:hypothetical protein